MYSVFDLFLSWISTGLYFALENTCPPNPMKKTSTTKQVKIYLWAPNRLTHMYAI